MTSSLPRKHPTTGSTDRPTKDAAGTTAARILGRFATARDTVRRLDGREGDLEVVSLLPKDHWLINVLGIGYRDQTYFLASREVIGYGTKARHRFLLRKATEETIFSGHVHYWPHEVREVHRQQQRARSETWVGTFAVVLGLLDAHRLQRLAQLYPSFEPRKATRWAIAACLLIGTTNLVQTSAAVFSQAAGAGYLTAFVVGILLVWDGVQRLMAYRRGVLEASLFSKLAHPLANRFLRWDFDIQPVQLTPGRSPGPSLEAETETRDPDEAARSRGQHRPEKSPTPRS